MDTALQTFGQKSESAAALARRMAGELTLASPDEDWIMAESMLKEAGTFLSEFRTAFKEAFANRLKERGDIEIGDGRRFYAGKVKKVTRKVDPANLFDALMEAAGGDLDRVAVCLSVNFAKPAEVRELSPELYDLSYTEEFVLNSKTGKPKRQPVLTR